MLRRSFVFAILGLTIGCTGTSPTAGEKTFFDDFHYANIGDLAANRWIIRTELGWPGVPGSMWGPESFSLHDDPAAAGNRVLRMTSMIEGKGTKTRQSQICHERKYLKGTYAARVRFTDEPTMGPNGDPIVETFYMISPLKAPMDVDYSELDFEYLPNGGWGHTAPTMFGTTWETFRPEPEWFADNQSGNRSGNLAGWRTLVLQVGDGKARYFVDGTPLAEHGGKVYPESLMAINFNLWFIRDGLLDRSDRREWVEDIDWVFHRAGKLLTPSEVDAEIAEMRKRGVRFTDTVPAPVPALVSPCNF